jgi:hypothetical protein
LLNFNLITQKETTMAEMCGQLTLDDLRQLTNEMVDRMLGLIVECADEDVTFVPSDPKAQDDFAATEAERNISWTLGHLIVHTTATAEEGAFLAAELARGVQREGRSRSEIPWETVTTIAQCRVRLEESRRMRLATLEVWPDQPHLDNSITLGFLEGPINPPARFALGLFHDHGHVKQIAEVVRQAQAARLE